MVEVKLSFTSVDEMLAYFVEQRMVSQSMPPIVAASVVDESTKSAAKRTRRVREDSSDVGKSSGLTTQEVSETSQPSSATSASNMGTATVDNSATASQVEVSVPNAGSASSAEATSSAPSEAQHTPAHDAPASSSSSRGDEEVTVEQIRAYANSRIEQDDTYRDKMVQAINSFGARKLSEIASDKLADLMAKLKEL